MDIYEEYGKDSFDIKKGRFLYRRYDNVHDRLLFATRYLLSPFTLGMPYKWFSIIAYLLTWFIFDDYVLENSMEHSFWIVIVLYVIIQGSRLALCRFFKKNYERRFSLYKDKYETLTNQYLENLMSDYGFEYHGNYYWSGEYLGGVLEVGPRAVQFKYPLLNDYGRIRAFENIGMVPTDDNHIVSGMTKLVVGLKEFDESYTIFTEDLVKARNYFSATMVNGLMNVSGMVARTLKGVYVNHNELILSYDMGGFLDLNIELDNHDMNYYIEQLNRWKNNVEYFVDCVDNSRFLFENR